MRCSKPAKTSCSAMASSRNSPPAEGGGRSSADVTAQVAKGRHGAARGIAPADAVDAAVAAALSKFVAPGARVAVAVSGGIDSIVLLDALATLAARHSLTLSAIHVNHGLSPNAPAWARFCAEQCALRALPLTVHELQLARTSGESLEARARAARYACFDAAAVDVVALGHHADDQAETVLLQLLRGAGPRGLAAMPSLRPGRPALLRPLLGLTRAAIAARAQARQLQWITDESNDDTRYRRNLLRHAVAPVLGAEFPGYPLTLARAAAHQAEASELLDALAQHDTVCSCRRLSRSTIEFHSQWLLDDKLGRSNGKLEWFCRL